MGRFVQRQANDPGIAAREEAHEARGAALNGIATGLASPFSTFDISIDIPRIEASEGDGGFDQPFPQGPARLDERHRRHHPMPAAGEEREAGAGLLLRLRLGQDTAAGGHHCIGGQHPVVGMETGDGLRLVARDTLRIGTRHFAPKWRLIDVGGEDKIRFQAKLSEKLAAAGTSGRQNQAASIRELDYLNRKVMRPLVRS